MTTRSSGEPALSVVIPCYNHRSQIARAIQSAIDQVGDDSEIIVVDDGSTDGSPEAIRPFVEKGAVQLIRQSNAGPGAARNAGILAARGRYIALLDADDEWVAGSVKSRIECLEAHPEVNLVFTDTLYRLDADDPGVAYLARAGFADKFASAVIRRDGDTLVLSDAYISLAIRYMPMFSTSTAMFRRAALARVGLFDTTLRASEDTDYWFRFSRLGPIALIHRPLSHWNSVDSQMTKATERFCLDAIRFYRRLPASFELSRRSLRDVRWKLYVYYYACGYILLQRNDRSGSRKMFYRAWVQAPWQIRTYAYLLGSLLPHAVVSSMTSEHPLRSAFSVMTRGRSQRKAAISWLGRRLPWRVRGKSAPPGRM